MILLIVGLGNPDKKYHLTRHNVGYLVVDWFTNQSSLWLVQSPFSIRGTDSGVVPTDIGTPQNDGEPNHRHSGLSRVRSRSEFLKTHGVYMNNSGKFVARELKKRGLKPDQLILIHDDLDLPLGEFKLQFSRGDAGHKGVRSVVETLGTKDFWRLRIGIGRPEDGGNPEEYVLRNFSKEELSILQESVFPSVTDELKAQSSKRKA